MRTSQARHAAHSLGTVHTREEAHGKGLWQTDKNDETLIKHQERHVEIEHRKWNEPIGMAH